jgi:dihydroflavonol-4-reductase
VLVTGATGFLAGHCIDELVRHGYAVRGTVRDPATADVAHLTAIAERAGGSVEFVPARLEADDGWAQAVEGCAYVLHVASPNPAEVPKDAEQVIRPAVDGTLRVLRAARAAGVRRVVVTSSTSAVAEGYPKGDRQLRTEQDWSVADNISPYARSKYHAERAAWEFAGAHGLELVVLNPSLILGPLLHRERTTSVEVVRRLLSRDVPLVPKIGFHVVDVRDLAAAHRLAMESPDAAGNRYICAGEFRWMREMAEILRERYAPRGYRIPTRPLPYWLMWTIARFDKTIRLALGFVGVRNGVSAAKIQRELGWTTRGARESIVDTAESLLRYGVVDRGAGDRGADPVAAAGAVGRAGSSRR